jgi:hypothetical protein
LRLCWFRQQVKLSFTSKTQEQSEGA